MPDFKDPNKAGEVKPDVLFAMAAADIDGETSFDVSLLGNPNQPTLTLQKQVTGVPKTLDEARAMLRAALSHK